MKVVRRSTPYRSRVSCRPAKRRALSWRSRTWIRTCPTTKGWPRRCRTRSRPAAARTSPWMLTVERSRSPAPAWRWRTSRSPWTSSTTPRSKVRSNTTSRSRYRTARPVRHRDRSGRFPGLDDDRGHPRGRRPVGRPGGLVDFRAYVERRGVDGPLYGGVERHVGGRRSRDRQLALTDSTPAAVTTGTYWPRFKPPRTTICR